MNSHNIKGFSDELEKLAMPRILIKAFSPIKAWRAGVSGEKKMLRIVDKEIRGLKMKDPSFDVASYKFERLNQLKTQGAAAAEEHAKAILEGAANKVPGQGFLAKHKGKLLLGGAAVGGIYLANKMNDYEEEKKKQMFLQNRGIVGY